MPLLGWVCPGEKLLIASRNGDYGRVKKLLRIGVPVDHTDKSGNTSLILAVEKNRPNVFKLLFEAGANVDHQNKWGETALMLAARKDQFNTVLDLIKAGASLDLQDEYGFTALMNAATSVEVYATGDSMYSARAGGIEVLRQLINNGDNLNLQDKNGNTALMQAVFDTRLRLDAVNLLLQSGADPNIVNNNGHTAYSLAKDLVIKHLIDKYLHVGAINYLKKDGFTYFSVIPNDLNQLINNQLKYY